MNLDEFRTEMERYREHADREAQSRRDPYIALDRLHLLYLRFDDAARAMANQVLGEWVLSDDASKRYNAIALIRDFKVNSAAPALQQLADRLADSDELGASDERNKASDLARDLEAEQRGVSS